MRPRIDLMPYRSIITSCYQDGMSVDDIADYLAQRGVRVTGRTVKARLTGWGVPTVRHQTDDTPELRIRIGQLFYSLGLGEQEMLRILRLEGFSVEQRRLQRIRLELGLRRSTHGMDLEARHEDQNRLEEIVRQELDWGKIESYGRGHLYYHFRSLHVIISRDRLFDIVKRLDPLGVQRRLRRNLRIHRGHFISPGPNFCWSIDAHCKLDHWGFEIYAGIDQYSRAVTWSYCGISSHTPVSVMAQYVRVWLIWLLNKLLMPC